jgi:hypothetical protein
VLPLAVTVGAGNNAVVRLLPEHIADGALDVPTPGLSVTVIVTDFLSPDTFSQ